MLVFKNPEWLALLPALAVVGWYWRRLRLWKPLRVVFLLLAILVLMRPQMRLVQEGMDLYVLLDRSDSTEGRVDKQLPEWQKLLESGKRSRHDRLFFVDYAADVLPQEVTGAAPFTGSRKLTRTNFAIQNTIAMRDPDRPSRVLAFTDGYSTESLAGLSDKLQRENIPLDVRFFQEFSGEDFRITRVKIPPRAQVSEPFLIEIEVAGPGDAELPINIVRDGQRLLDTKVKVTKGRGVARFTDRIAKAGARKYEATITPPQQGDLAGNNRYESWIEVAGGPRILLITKYENDPVIKVLEAQGWAVDVVTQPQSLSIGQLSGCRGVILNNVPAFEIPSTFLASLPFFVEQQGGGLLMVGGKQSFGSGGYFHSAIDPVLPVSMEMKMDQRKTAVAMAIVMDRSGSMGAPVGGGRLKMDLANEGAAEAVNLLGYNDYVGVYAVDSEPHEAVGMQMIGTESNKTTITKLCRRITVGGGGIYTYTGLKAGWDALKETNYGTRHLILFADAADAEEPGDYINLLDEMTRDGATVSVIALGTKADSDAKFLEDVAARGKGRIFFTEKPEEIPIIFTQETVAVARSAFIEDKIECNPTGGWFEISGKDFSWLPSLDGYNLSYKKEWASQALVSTDEYTAPLVAWGQRGAGRSAAVAFPIGGKFSESVRGWNKYGDFIQTLGRWLMGDELPPGLGLKFDIIGTELKLDLMFDSTWEPKFAAKTPRIVVAEGPQAEIQREITWRRLAPGHYSVSTDMGEGSIVRGVIQADKYTLPFGPFAVGSSAEWQFDPARLEELRQTVVQSGGRELLDLSQAWLSPPVEEWADIRLSLLIALLVLLLADALVTRMGWHLPEFAGWKTLRAAVASRSAPIAAAAKSAPSPASPTVSPAPSPSAAPQPQPTSAEVTPADSDADREQRRSRFTRAKK